MKYIKYFKTICIHKWYVFIECVKEGIIWQGIIHDISKFHPCEFIKSANYYFGDKGNSDTSLYINEKYQEAWLHHKGHNKHHWEYWVDWNSSNGEYILTEIPLRYMKEMYADMVGASKAYNKGNFNNQEPYNYFNKSCNGWVINANNKKWIEEKLKKLSLK